jgi:hypothetical protein
VYFRKYDLGMAGVRGLRGCACLGGHEVGARGWSALKDDLRWLAGWLAIGNAAKVPCY